MKRCFKAADILLPDMTKTDAKKWAVVACDQFTSEPEYWESAEREVGDAPSTLRLILPEVYLSETESRISKINSTMKEYLNGVLTEHKDSMIYVERTQSDGDVRRGVVLAVDLEEYDYKKGANALIRATEATVVERIPPRVAIRRGAAIELPHVMMLIDDPDFSVIEPLTGKDGEIAYDTELMLGGGHIKGRFLSCEEKKLLTAALDNLISPEKMAERYGEGNLAPLLFAVGDGNHSLASAKAAYEEIKARIGDDAASTHPARYALVEVVNVHDASLKFEPIYRVMFGVDPTDVLAELKKYASTLDGSASAQTVRYVSAEGEGTLTVDAPVRQLTVGTLQDFIDEYIKSHDGAEVDYIHGINSTETLALRNSAIGFIFDGMGKADLFKTVIFDGALPRKTFSMGHAEDKRYYLEARKITL
ncbi:MAG: DUF1015 domain-containing protein [Ruminococcaceae bacterium]|nr:DUF1015 domain-containing protein [Oscillospiraceae bacterium]